MLQSGETGRHMRIETSAGLGNTCGPVGLDLPRSTDGRQDHRDWITTAATTMNDNEPGCCTLSLGMMRTLDDTNTNPNNNHNRRGHRSRGSQWPLYHIHVRTFLTRGND